MRRRSVIYLQIDKLANLSFRKTLQYRSSETGFVPKHTSRNTFAQLSRSLGPCRMAHPAGFPPRKGGGSNGVLLQSSDYSARLDFPRGSKTGTANQNYCHSRCTRCTDHSRCTRCADHTHCADRAHCTHYASCISRTCDVSCASVALTASAATPTTTSVATYFFKRT